MHLDGYLSNGGRGGESTHARLARIFSHLERDAALTQDRTRTCARVREGEAEQPEHGG